LPAHPMLSLCGPDPRCPDLSARYRFVSGYQPVERALRKSRRHVWQGRGVRDGAHERGAPRLTRAAVVADLQALEIVVDAQRPACAEPVEKPEIEPGAEDMGVEPLFDLSRQQLSRRAVDDAVHEFDRAPIEDR